MTAKDGEWFWHVLTLAIGGCTITELQARMSQAEFHEWSRFYSMFPFDDLHRFHRPAALIAHAIGGGDLQARVNWLQPEPGTFGMNDADMETMKAFGFKRKGG